MRSCTLFSRALLNPLFTNTRSVAETLMAESSKSHNPSSCGRCHVVFEPSLIDLISGTMKTSSSVTSLTIDTKKIEAAESDVDRR